MRRVRFGCPSRSLTSWRLPDWSPPRSRRPGVHVTLVAPLRWSKLARHSSSWPFAPLACPRAYDCTTLRHTCASLIAQGASVKAVQAQLGHATASIVLDTYGHLFPSEMEALAGRLEQARTAALGTGSGPHADQPSATSAKPLVVDAEEVGFERSP
jgi:hypothetical protein